MSLPSQGAVNIRAQTLGMDIRKDAQIASLLWPTARMVGPGLLLLMVNLFVDLWWPLMLGMAAFTIVIPTIAMVSRNNWGNQILIRDGCFTVVRKGVAWVSLSVQDITFHSVGENCLLLAWYTEGKRKTLCIGKESFSENTWRSLTASFNRFCTHRDVV